MYGGLFCRKKKKKNLAVYISYYNIPKFKLKGKKKKKDSLSLILKSYQKIKQQK